MRPLLPVLVLLPLSAPAQVGEREDSRDDTERLAVEATPEDRLGFGTAADLFVEVGGGAWVSVWSGNLVLRIEPLPRGDVPADVRFALTYNHRDEEGLPEVGIGWRYDLARRIDPGAWGDLVLTDADGFRDHFWAGARPDADTVGDMADRVAAAWRRTAPAAVRRALGGPRGMRALLDSDPDLLAELRVQLLGAPERGDGPWRSVQRGRRELAWDAGYRVRRADGGSERYGVDGALVGVELRGGGTVEPVRTLGALTGIRYEGIERVRIGYDSARRIESLDDLGRTVRFGHADRFLERIEAEGGTWRLRYDSNARIERVEGPQGAVAVHYDAVTGRVAGATGPLGDVRFDATLGDDGIAVQITGLPRGTVRAVRTGRRAEVVSDTGVEAIEFADAEPLPLEARDRTGAYRFRWREGRLLSAARVDGAAVIEELAIERSAGEPTAMIGPARYDVSGHGAGLTVRDAAGRSATRPASESVLERDDRGRLRNVEAARGFLALRRDDLGRVRRLEGPSGLVVDLTRGERGAVEAVAAAGVGARLRYDGRGLISGWEDATGNWTLARDAAGRLAGVAVDGAVLWAVERGPDGRPQAYIRQGERLAIGWDGAGPASWDRPGGRSVTIGRDAAGRITRYEDDGDAALELDASPLGPLAVHRGASRYLLARDPSGRVDRVSDGAGVDYSLQLDDAGRIERVEAGGVRWSLRHDGGRLASFDRGSAPFSLAFDRRGAITEIAVPGPRVAAVEVDRRGQPDRVVAPGGAALDFVWTDSGLGRAASLDALEGRGGAVEGWANGASAAARYRIERGFVVAIDGAVTRDEGRDSFGRPRSVGWGRGGPESAAGVVARRDPTGRLTRLEEGGTSVEFDRDLLGDVRSIRASWHDRAGPSWELDVDGAGRLRAVRPDGEAEIRITRDRLGRSARVEQGDRVLEVEWLDLPRDGATDVARQVGLKVEKPTLRPPGSRRLVFSRAGKVIRRWEELRNPDGSASAPSPWPEVPTLFGVPKAGGADGLVPADAALLAAWAGLLPEALGGDAVVAARWWSGLRPRALETPPGLADRAAAEPRPGYGDRGLDALLPTSSDPNTGAGALLPPLPGSTRIVPGLAGTATVSPWTALRLTGDLEDDLDGDAALLAQVVRVPGAHLLAAIVARRADPSAPPGWSMDEASAIRAGGRALLLAAGSRRDAHAAPSIEPLLPGLPPGVGELPSPFEPAPWSDEGRWRRDATDAVPIAIRALSRFAAPALSGAIDGLDLTEVIVIELPSGARLAVDARGEPLSIDAGARTLDVAPSHIAATLGLDVLSRRDPEAERYVAAYVPERGPVPECRAGGLPGHPFPLDRLLLPVR